MGRPAGYLITFTTYGSWLHGRNHGSVNDEHNCYGEPFLRSNTKWQRQEKQLLKNEPFVMDGNMRDVAIKTVIEVSKHRHWLLYAAHIRSNHIHLVIDSEVKPEKIMNDMKAWLTRRLREHYSNLDGRRLWTRHGSTKYLWNHTNLFKATDYVLNKQGEPMSVYDNRQSMERKRQDFAP